MIKTRIAMAIISVSVLCSGLLGFFIGKLAVQNMQINELVAQRVEEMSAMLPALPKSFEAANDGEPQDEIRRDSNAQR